MHVKLRLVCARQSVLMNIKLDLGKGNLSPLDVCLSEPGGSGSVEQGNTAVPVIPARPVHTPLRIAVAGLSSGLESPGANQFNAI